MFGQLHLVVSIALAVALGDVDGSVVFSAETNNNESNQETSYHLRRALQPDVPAPTDVPSTSPSASPSVAPSATPTGAPSLSSSPSAAPSATPTGAPSVSPAPSAAPTGPPSSSPTTSPAPTTTPPQENLSAPKQIYFNEVLDTGDVVTIFRSGPVTVDIECRSSHVALALTLLNNAEEMLIVGDLDGANRIGRTLAKGELYKRDMWEVFTSGNDINHGSVWTSSEHFVAFNGASISGMQRDDGLPVVGGNCAIAGALTYVIPDGK